MHPKDTVLVPLTQGKVALVDAEDAERVLQLRWCAANDHNSGRYYAVHSKNGHPNIKMHRFIMDAPKGVMVDHINGDGLDNRKCNLRLATHSENLWNSKVGANKSGFRGVYPTTKGKWFGGWRATIGHHGKHISLGTFDTPEEAARAWDRAARELRGDFAVLNFPHETPSTEE